MAVLSHTAEYALRAVFRLAAQREGSMARVGELSDALGIPQNYLAKTLSQLARGGVLSSSRGKRGGFALARSPADITLDRVVAIFEPVGRRHCLLGNQVCNERRPCEAHASWAPISDRMAEFFRNTTVADILDRHANAPDAANASPIRRHRSSRRGSPGR
jgi:Rrf2 family protein